MEMKIMGKHYIIKLKKIQKIVSKNSKKQNVQKNIIGFFQEKTKKN